MQRRLAKLAILATIVGGLILGSSEAWATDNSPGGDTAAPAETDKVAEPAKSDTSGAESDAASETATGAETKGMTFRWSDGLLGETSDKAFRIHIGGRIDWDNGWFSAPANVQNSLNTPLLDGTDLRRFRFLTEGTICEQVEFKLEADFSRAADFKDFQPTPQNAVFITDAYLAVHDIPCLGTIRAGHQKEYLTFANATSSLFTNFMERPYIFDAFEDSFMFDSGIAIYRSYLDQHATSWFGAFWNGTRTQAFNVGGGYALSGRLTVLPIYDEAEQCWLNLGVSGSLRSSSRDSDPMTVSVRPLVRTGQSFQVPNLINTGQLLSRDGLQILGTGIHAAWGRFTFGSEFLCWNIDNAFTGGLPNPDGTLPPGVQSAGNLFFSGCYAEALWFLTPGDHHPINREFPGYGRVRPVRDFLCVRDGACRHSGPGAWEIGLRYDHVDANSGLIQAGALDSLTVGLNWYLNPNAKIMTNYVYTFRNTGVAASTGSFNALGMRVHVDF